MNLFGEEEEPIPHPTPEGAKVVPRKPGWTFISNRQGPQGYHRIKSVASLGSVVTVCGITGRRVEEHQRGIIECPDCTPTS